jgi:hypothetical protein
MAVIFVTQYRVYPGKTEAFGAYLQKLLPILQRHGARTRVLSNTVAGQNTLTNTLLAETDDWASNGAYVDTVSADPDFQALLEGVLGPDAVATVFSNSIVQDLPIFLGAPQ